VRLQTAIICNVVGGVLTGVFTPPSARAANPNDFTEFSLRAENNALLLPGRLYVPPEATSQSTPRPLILFLHGAGESGTNNVAQVNQNIDNLLAEAQQRGAFLYAPQTNSGWASTTILNRTASMLDRALTQHNVDANRVYATGLSMGGGGVWNMINRYPNQFAAAVPIAAVSPGAGFLRANLVDQSIWAFHARNDNVVSVNSSRNVVTGILNAAQEPLPAFPSLRDTTTPFQFDSPALDLHYTEPPIGGHGIWFGVYAFDDMYDWMFAHALPEPATIWFAYGSLAFAACRCRRRRLRATLPPLASGVEPAAKQGTI
jgi:predicted peptidase